MNDIHLLTFALCVSAISHLVGALAFHRLLKRHRACKETLTRVAAARDAARWDKLQAEARSRGVGGGNGAKPSIERVDAATLGSRRTRQAKEGGR